MLSIFIFLLCRSASPCHRLWLRLRLLLLLSFRHRGGKMFLQQYFPWDFISFIRLDDKFVILNLSISALLILYETPAHTSRYPSAAPFFWRPLSRAEIFTYTDLMNPPRDRLTAKRLPTSPMPQQPTWGRAVAGAGAGAGGVVVSHLTCRWQLCERASKRLSVCVLVCVFVTCECASRRGQVNLLPTFLSEWQISFAWGRGECCISNLNAIYSFKLTRKSNMYFALSLSLSEASRLLNRIKSTVILV